MSEITLREYLEAVLKHEREQREMAARDAKESIDLAHAEIDRRLAQMNELREQITTERSTYLRRDIFDRIHDPVVNRIGALERWRSNIEGRIIMLGSVVVVINLIVAVIAVLFVKRSP
jgi:hypothetical protein